MADEMRHGSVGTGLSQAEWEAVGTHILNSQATGDIIYASSPSQLSRLGKATDGNLLQLASGIPAWTASPTIGSTSWANANHAHAASNSGGTLTTLGTISTGVWQGTAIAAGYVATLNQNTTGNAATATALATGRTINGVTFDGTGNVTVPAAAGTLTGSTLASGVTASSLTSVGTLTTLTVGNGSGDANVTIDGSGIVSLAFDRGSTNDWRIGQKDTDDFVWLTENSEKMRLTTGGIVGIGDTANASMTQGLTINQGAADDEIFALKSSDVAHGLTTYAETDTYYSIRKNHGLYGGAYIRVISEAGETHPYIVQIFDGNSSDTSKATSSWGTANFIAVEHDGSNGQENITSNGNIFAVLARVGGATSARFLIDEDGDLHADGTLSAYDTLDDAHLVRALDIARNSKDLIRNEWDNFLKYGEDKLVELGILGDTIENGGLLNVTGLQRLHNGAIWQGYVRQQELQVRVKELETKLLALEGAK